MRTAALVVGMFGGFAGVYFAQLLVTGTAVIGGLAAFLAVGPTLGNMLATPDGSTATPRATPTPRVTASGDGGPGAGSALVAVPFIGPVFLVVGAALALASSRRTAEIATPREPLGSGREG
jgi:hypothetical protein